MHRNYLVSYHPLCSTAHGLRALKNDPDLVPFSDGSCRREPDLQAKNPSITALCRGGLFAPRLAVGDRIFYMTVKGGYLGRAKGWALVAALNVIHTLESHEAAADWYRARNQPLPSNCIVSGNPYLPVEHTTGLPGDGPGMQQAWNQKGPPPKTMEEWDAHYQARAQRYPRFVVTNPLVAPRLNTPPIFAKANFQKIFDAYRVPGTQRYKVLSDREFDNLLELLAAS